MNILNFISKFDTTIIKYQNMMFWEHSHDKTLIGSAISERHTNSSIEFEQNKIAITDYYDLSGEDLNLIADEIFLYLMVIFSDKKIVLNLSKFYSNGTPIITFNQLEESIIMRVN